jgi:hypothetical protein
MRIARLLALLSVFAVVAVPGYAQTKVSTVPISRDVIVLKLVVGEGVAARVVSLNGGLIRVAVRNGATIGLIPSIQSGGIAVRLLEILADPTTGAESARQLSKANVAWGGTVRYDGPVALEVELAEIQPPATGTTVAAGGACTICCLTCGDITACACYVEMDCGKCCCPAGGCSCDISGRPAAAGQGDRSGLPGCATIPAKRRLE